MGFHIIFVTTKYGTIHISVDYMDLNKACPKDNYPTTFIDQIIRKCANSEIFFFVDNFSSYIQIQIKLEDQHNVALICPWGTLTYRKL